MIKYIGIIMLGTASVLAGNVMASRVKERVNELIYLKKLMLIFKGELRYKNSMLSDAFTAVALKAKCPYDRLFSGLSEATEDNYSSTMTEVFAAKIDEILCGHTYLNKEDIDGFKELGETMGYQDQKMQLGNIDLFIERLSHAIDDEKGKMNDSMKVYKTMGIMTGLLLTVVFI